MILGDLAIGKVREWIKRFGDDTPRLLRYVYGATEPMDGAREGQVLDFSRAQPLNAQPLKGRAPTRDEKRRFAEISARLKARYEAMAAENAKVPEGPRDEAYFNDLPSDDEQMDGQIVLKFESANLGVRRRSASRSPSRASWTRSVASIWRTEPHG